MSREALQKFRDLSIKKSMPNRELLGIMLRDDKFLNMLAGSEDDIRRIWKQETGQEISTIESESGDEPSFFQNNTNLNTQRSGVKFSNRVDNNNNVSSNRSKNSAT